MFTNSLNEVKKPNIEHKDSKQKPSVIISLGPYSVVIKSKARN